MRAVRNRTLHRGVATSRAAVAALPGVARTRTALVMQNRFQRGERL